MNPLSEHFSKKEFERSQIARKREIGNTLRGEHLSNAKVLCNVVLEPLRGILSERRGTDTPIIITSGYRSPQLNDIIGGAEDSQHTLGQAADFYAPGYRIEEIFQIVRDSEIPYDQVIQEFDEWIHISYDPYKSGQRYEALRATHGTDGVEYNYA